MKCCWQILLTDYQMIRCSYILPWVSWRCMAQKHHVVYIEYSGNDIAVTCMLDVEKPKGLILRDFFVFMLSLIEELPLWITVSFHLLCFTEHSIFKGKCNHCLFFPACIQRVIRDYILRRSFIDLWFITVTIKYL